MSRFNNTSTTDEVLEGIDLSQKFAVVTGASSGLGYETCRALASAGAEVVMVARREDVLKAAKQKLLESIPSAKLSTLILDLADLDSVRTAASTLLRRISRIDILVNNAGLMACEEAYSAEGCEMQFATNHIGHFLFSCLLVPALVAEGSSRVVTLSSGGHKYSAVDFDDLNFDSKPYDKWLAYGQAKTANALFAIEFGRRLQRKGVRSFAVHPGVIITDLGRHLTDADIQQMMEEAETNGLKVDYKSIPQGAATSVWAATSPELADKNGLYLEDCQIAKEVAPENASSGYLAYAVDADQAKRLWEVSEKVVGQVFDF